MSYILDALKKAERERELTKVPNIETVHDTAVKKKKIAWIAAECGVVCLIAAAWFYFGSSSERIELKTPQPTAIQQSTATEVSTPPPETRKSIDQIYNAPPVSPGITVNPPIPEIVDATIATMPEIQSRTAAVKPESPGGNKITESRTAAAKPDSSVTDTNADTSVAVITSATLQKSPPVDDTALLPAANAAKPATAERESSKISVNSQSLREIAGSMKMNISFHVYSDNPDRRMVFINGKRYREGDSLEQDCILERITPEGMILRRGKETVSIRVDGGAK